MFGCTKFRHLLTSLQGRLHVEVRVGGFPELRATVSLGQGPVSDTQLQKAGHRPWRILRFGKFIQAIWEGHGGPGKKANKRGGGGGEKTKKTKIKTQTNWPRTWSGTPQRVPRSSSSKLHHRVTHFGWVLKWLWVKHRYTFWNTWETWTKTCGPLAV